MLITKRNKKYAREKRQSSLLDFSPLFSHLLSKYFDTMNILGVSFILYVLKLSSGTGFCHKLLETLFGSVASASAVVIYP